MTVLPKWRQWPEGYFLQAHLKPDLPETRHSRNNGGALPYPTKSFRIFPWLATGIRLFTLLLVGGLVVLVAYEWDWWVGSAVQQSTDDAYLQADMTPIAAKTPGYVRSVPVRDFQKVKAGDLLIEIVDDDYRAQLEQAEANVAAAQAGPISTVS